MTSSSVKSHLPPLTVKSSQSLETSNVVEPHARPCTPDSDSSTVSATTPTTPRSVHFPETNTTVPPSTAQNGTLTIPTNPPISPLRTENLHFQETGKCTFYNDKFLLLTRAEVRTAGKKERRQSLSITRSCPLDTHPGARPELDWKGKQRANLVKQGYQALCVMCTFVAGVQGQFLQLTYTRTDTRSQIITALFFTGLFADIGAAILSASSARWYEMLTPQEADHVYDWLHEPHRLPLKPTSLDHLEAQTSPHHNYVNERWLNLSLKSGLYAAFVGLGCLVSGLMLYVWSNMPLVVQIMGTVACACTAILLPPFFLPHDRVQTLKYVRLHRWSGRDIVVFK